MSGLKGSTTPPPHLPEGKQAPDSDLAWEQSLRSLKRKSLKMWLLISLFQWLAGLSQRSRMRIGAFLTHLTPWLIRKRIKIVRRNLELCFPELSPPARQALERQHLRALTQSFVDRSVFWFGSAQTIRELIHVTGHEQVAQLIAAHGSVMLLAPHFIGLDAAATRLTLEGPEGATMYTPQSNADIDALVRLGRARFNTVHLVSRRDGIRPLIRHIEQHLPIYYLPDMDFGRKGAVFVPFFGLDAATQTATAQIARKWQQPVLPVISEWDPQTGHYTITVRAPLTDFPGTDTLESATARLNVHIESWIRACPSQYYWVHRRFKTRPMGQTKLY
jgi:KDO2-lipid IV(A) lauroyltransferase